MMNRERFEQLAGAVDSGDASAEERAELEAALTADPLLAAEWRETRLVDAALRHAVQPRTNSPIAIPPQVLRTLDEVRRSGIETRHAEDQLRRRAAPVLVSPLPDKTARGEPTRGAEKLERSEFRPARRSAFSVGLALAACLALLLGIAAVWWPWLRPNDGSSAAAVTVLAPRGVTGVTEPVLDWEVRPGQRYDVWILPAEGNHVEAPALYTAKDVEPPVRFGALQPGPGLNERREKAAPALLPGRDYRLLVCLANASRVAGVAVPFRTAPDAIRNLPAPSLAAARQLAASGRPSDALMLLDVLPAAERTEPAAQELQRELRAQLSAMPTSER